MKQGTNKASCDNNKELQNENNSGKGMIACVGIGMGTVTITGRNEIDRYIK